MTSSQSSQKVLLAKALQVANTAVHLDEAGDVKGAMSSYLDACSGLQLAMHGIEDREKVKSIVSIGNVDMYHCSSRSLEGHVYQEGRRAEEHGGG
jgi:hypothetical protein